MDYKSQIAIIIPSLNPDEKLLTLLKDLNDAEFQNIILVNDGSSEKYTEKFEIAKQQYGCSVITHSVNLGKGRALKNAFNFVLTECPECIGAITVDSDGQHTIPDIISCAEALIENPNYLVMGCRDFSSENIPFRSRFGNKTTCRVLKLLCGIGVSDTQTGLRGLSCDLMKKAMTVKGERFEYEMNMLIDTKQWNIPIKEVPIQTIYIEENKTSHFNPLLDSIRIYSVFGKFIISSLLSFVVDIVLFTVIIAALKSITPVPSGYILIATIGARIFSACVNYLLNKNTVFKHKNAGKTAIIKYFILFTVQLLASATLVGFLFRLTGIHETVIKVIVDALLFLISFQIQREWVFRNRKGRT